MIRLERRSRRTQQRQRTFAFCSDDRHIAPVITRRLFLLVSILLLLIHNDQAKILQWRKHRRTRPHDYARLPVAHAPPLASTFHVAQSRVQNRDAFILRTKPRPALPPNPQSQCNLRHQNNRRFSPRESLLHATQINFRLPATCHAVQQLHAEFSKLESRANTLHRALLLFIQSMSWRRVSHVERILCRIDRFFPSFKQAIRQHAVNQTPRNLRELDHLWKRQRPAFCLKQCPYSLFFLVQRFVCPVRKSLPRNNRLRFSLRVLQTLPNFDQAKPLHPLQAG